MNPKNSYDSKPLSLLGLKGSRSQVSGEAMKEEMLPEQCAGT